MKKIIVTITLSFIMCVMFLGSASAVSWSSSESLAIPSWGAMSNPTSASKNKTKKCSYGYIEKTLDNTAFGKYGDFYKGGRISKTYYQIYLNNQTKIHYTDANAKKTISSVKARVCGSNLEHLLEQEFQLNSQLIINYLLYNYFPSLLLEVIIYD